MAKSIRNTPILTGKDADMFLETISLHSSREEREKERKRLMLVSLSLLVWLLK